MADRIRFICSNPHGQVADRIFWRYTVLAVQRIVSASSLCGGT
jgi:hypothetical protein